MLSEDKFADEDAGGCARCEPQTKCQRYRKSGSPTFKEWKETR